MSVRWRVSFGGRDVVVEGPEDAAVKVTVPAAAVTADGFDPTEAYMRGSLKAEGNTGVLFGVLADGSALSALTRLASRP